MPTGSRASALLRLLRYRSPLQNPSFSFFRQISTFPLFPVFRTSPFHFLSNFGLIDPSQPIFSRKISFFPHHGTPWNTSQRSRISATSRSSVDPEREIINLLADLEKEKEREREERRKAGLDTKDIDEEDGEDYMGLRPFIEILEKEKLKDASELYRYEEPSDSDSELDEIDQDAERKEQEIFKRKCERHRELLQDFVESETLDEAFMWMNKIDKFEEKHFKLRPEYRVIGELMDRLKMAEGKEKFILQQKLNRAMNLVEWKEAFDPNNPANYGVIKREDTIGANDAEAAERERESQLLADGANDEEDVEKENDDEDDEEEFDDMKERDDILSEKLNKIDKILEQKLSELDHTFGKKGKFLEEEIRDLAEERNALMEKKRQPLYRKGFDVQIIDVNRTTKVTKGGRVERYTAVLVCGNYEGVVGYAKAKAHTAQAAIQKANEKCYQNLHYIERHEEHTIAHAIQTSYKKTKVYLWPASTRTGMKAGRIIKVILNLAGFKNVKSKVVGSRNAHNTVKAVFKALNAIETPKDVQEKFGRTVVEKYLL